MPEDTVDFTVDEVPCSVPAGRTLAAALTESGMRSWRRTAGGAPRGVFCGIGVCFDCLVTLNGTTGVRACLVDVLPGDQVVREEGSGHAERTV